MRSAELHPLAWMIVFVYGCQDAPSMMIVVAMELRVEYDNWADQSFSMIASSIMVKLTMNK